MNDRTDPNRYVWIVRGSVLLLLGVHFLFCISSARIKSPTIDEYTYISTGYVYVKTGDFRLDRTHPPLIRLLIGLPLQFVSFQEPPFHEDQWGDPISYELGYSIGSEMLLEHGNDIQTLLMAARIPVMLLSCCLALLLFLWSKQLYGTAGGFIVLFLYCLSPNILAHARLATLDLGTCFFMILALFTQYCYMRKTFSIYFFLAGVSLGLALATKVTALILLPVMAFSLAWNLYPKKASWRHFPWMKWFTTTGLLYLIAFVTLLVVYGFPLKPFYYLDTLHNVVVKSSAAGKGGEAIPGMPHRNYAFYLMGQYSTDGWPYYYLVAFLIKTPLPVLLALLVVLAATYKKKYGLADVMIFSTAVLLHLLAAMNRVNIGLRHILPFYPLLFLYLGRITYLWPNRYLKWFTIFLGIGYIVSSIQIYPDYLSYFNELVGGPSHGHEYLDDSNIDWGQDLGRLSEVKKQHPDQPLYIAHHWIFHPQAYHFDARLMTKEQVASPPHGIVAVSKHWAIRNRITRRSPYYFDWLEKYELMGEVGHSIWLFQFE